ncbi:DUF1295 domain-containing protein [Phyllobacterium sp. YR531]|uniref:DUF1295 domain-containing protein n=1 Tax=Phyllobacterium sp. YR531 TaxID=1144343 RepID=UPI00026FA1A1|nr:DUF1295 domain-containing protein [Phyllobacterium sp. YR531]EJN00554.1 putative membrane protein [Phyllobacterium sp. YR531]
MGEAGLLLFSAVAFCLIMAVAWQMQRITGNDGWADVFWSYGVGVTGIGVVLMSPGASPSRRWLIATMLAAWSLRLGTHILLRTLKSHDDPRYADLRKEWGDHAPWRMFLFLQSQAVAGWVLVSCIYIAVSRQGEELDIFDHAGAFIMVIAIAGEAIADRQLRDFARNNANRGKVCDVGLWRWSRHPNYFFEWLGWVSYAVVAVGSLLPYGWLALAAPTIMYILLRHVSGVPPLEKHMLRSRGEAFREYQRRTSIFFPVPPSAY